MGECFLKKRLMISILAGGLMAAMLPGVVAAAPPDKSEIPFTIQHLDLENGLVTFGNRDRDEYCTPAVIQFEKDIAFWIDNGGAFPNEPAFPAGSKPIPVQTKATGKGAIVASARGSGLSVELWTRDNDPPLVGPCTDTDDEGSLFAAGTMRFQGKDNDFDVSGTRGNAFGDQGKANVTGDSGKYMYSWLFRLNDHCYMPDGGPPACLIDTSTLRARN
jgi:hypothetical protein